MGVAISNLCLWWGKVVGVKDYRMGEEICACIRLKKGEKTTEEEMKAFCKGKVGPSTRPKLMLLRSNPLSLPASQPSVPLSQSSPAPHLPKPMTSPSLTLYLPLVCRSPTSRFPAMSCLSQTSPSPSQERYVKGPERGRGAWGPRFPEGLDGPANASLGCGQKSLLRGWQ